jgi:hypothetical protein
MSKSETLWEKANISYRNYMNYIREKQERFEVTFIDLLYISNFKGGNASVHEDEVSVNSKLKKYSEHLKEIQNRFDNRQLKELSNEELTILKTRANSFLSLTQKDNTSVEGFKGSYASALLHFYFPDLIPILDRRVLNGTGIKKVWKKEQVKNIEQYYASLIDHFYHHLRNNPGKSLRAYDKENFIKPVEDEENASV